MTGLQLSAAFYAEVVAPQLVSVPHAAALLGWGSDVLGYDDVRSTDHGWGPRLQVFTDRSADEVALRLPERFRGRPVSFGWAGLAPRSWVQVLPLGEWLTDHLGVDARPGLGTVDWLLTPQQKLLGAVGGVVLSDPQGELEAVRATLAWFPDQVWRWLLACQWRRLAQEEAFLARTAEVGDAVGSVVTANRQVRDLMRLALLQARSYAPYQKWLGTAFAALPDPDGLGVRLAAAARGDQEALGAAYLTLAGRHDAGGLTRPLRASLGSYHERPARVLMADRFADALRSGVTDPFLRGLPLIGSVDQVVDSTDVLVDPDQFRRLAVLYR